MRPRSSRFRRVRRAGFLLALIALAIAPVTLAPTPATADRGEDWSFSVVSREAWQGTLRYAAEPGNIVPVEFRLDGFRGLDLFNPAPPMSMGVDCDTRAPRAIPTPPVSQANGILTYDTFTGTYTFWWSRAPGWLGTCRTLVLELADGTVHPLFVYFGETSTVISAVTEAPPRPIPTRQAKA